VAEPEVKEPEQVVNEVAEPEVKEPEQVVNEVAEPEVKEPEAQPAPASMPSAAPVADAAAAPPEVKVKRATSARTPTKPEPPASVKQV
jgi:hypothetical protein